MAITEQGRQNVVSNNYLHSNRFNFYNAAIEGKTFSEIADKVEQTKAYQNMQRIKSKMISMRNQSREQEKIFFQLVNCTGPEQFSNRYLRTNSNDATEADFNKNIAQNAQYSTEIRDAILREIGKRINEDKKFLYYLMGFDSEQLAEEVVKRLDIEQVTIDNKTINIFTEMAQNGISSVLLDAIQKQSVNKDKALYEVIKLSGVKNPRGGKLDFYSKDYLNKISKNIETQVRNKVAPVNIKNLNAARRKNPEQLGIFLSKTYSLMEEIMLEWKIEDKDNKIHSQIKKYLNRYGPKILDEANQQLLYENQVYKTYSGAAGGQLEFSINIMLNAMHINGVKIKFEATGPIKTHKTLYSYNNNKLQDINKKTNKNTKIIKRNGVKYIKDSTFVGEIRQDGIMTIKPKNREEIKFGFQMKNTHLDKSTVHLQKTMQLDYLLATMEANDLIDNKIRDELIYMLTNFYYFKNKNEDDKNKDQFKMTYKKENGDNGRYTADTSATYRYLAILLQAGIEMIIEPNLEEYTKNRMNEINQETNKSIVGNNFYIYHNTLIPISYFFTGIISLIDDYINLIKTKKQKTDYFTINEFSLYNTGSINTQQMNKDKKNILSTLSDSKGEYNYPMSLVRVGSQYGNQFIKGTKLGGYNIFLNLNKLQEQLDKMDWNIKGGK